MRKSNFRYSRDRQGSKVLSSLSFTLVELLVVIAVLSVLMSLLSPALQKAVYRARLTVCSTNLKHIGFMSLTYADDHNELYPARSNNMPDRKFASQIMTVDGDSIADILVPYVSSFDLLKCPQALADGVPYREPFPYHVDGSGGPISYNLWYNTGDAIWNISKNDPLSLMMRRVGDSFVFGKHKMKQGPKGLKFNILANDVTHTETSMHPEFGAKGVLHQSLSGKGIRNEWGLKYPTSGYYANVLTDDGAVHQYFDFKDYKLTKQMVVSHHEGTGGSVILPEELGW